MIFTKAKIASLAHVLPPILVSSEDLETRLAPHYERCKLPAGRLELQTGIKQRGHWPVGTAPSLIATEAAEKCLSKSSIARDKIDLLIFASVCRDFLEPATASVVHQKLGLSPHCQHYDLSQACLGVMSGIDLAAKLIESEQINAALIVSGENSGPLIKQTVELLNTNEKIDRKESKKYVANLTIGSAGVAVLVTKNGWASEGHQILASSVMSDTSANHLCQGSGDQSGLMMETNSPELLQAGVNLAYANWQNLKSEMKWNNDSADKYITHQVGSAHRELLYKSCELNLAKDFSSFEQWGNTGSAALPLTLSLASEAKFLKKGDTVAMLGIGSGISSVMLGVEW
ncbi:MAG: 3-oxoacyl-ACP synthase III [Bacteriovoracaceae bacterium]|nr:3-oxoacyl-ACP synthase III [Bacteriovoracaceae bacterium]